MAGRKPSVTSGPFLDLLAQRGISLTALAGMIRVKPDKLYRVLDGRMKKTYFSYIGAIARELSLPATQVRDVVVAQRQAFELAQVARQAEALAEFFAADKYPDRASAKAYGPTRSVLRKLRESCDKWLEMGYRRPLKLKPLRKSNCLAG